MTWGHRYACELHALLVEVQLLLTCLDFLLVLKIVEKDVAVLAATCEPCVVLEPVDSSYFVNVALTLHILRALTCVKVIDVNRILGDCCCKHVTAVAKLDFATAFDGKGRYVLLFL